MSEAVDTPWRPASAWAGHAQRGHGGRQGAAGVRLVPIAATRLATIIVREGHVEELAARLKARLGCGLPPTGRAFFEPRCDIVWSAPGQWLVVQHEDVSSDLAEVCSGVAALTDQGSSRALVEVSGRDAREALTKGFAIDLDPSVFAAGHAAVTAVAHMSVQIWQVDDAPRFMIAVPRSFAGSFWTWLTQAAAAYGYEVAAA